MVPQGTCNTPRYPDTVAASPSTRGNGSAGNLQYTTVSRYSCCISHHQRQWFHTLQGVNSPAQVARLLWPIRAESDRIVVFGLETPLTVRDCPAACCLVIKSEHQSVSSVRQPVTAVVWSCGSLFSQPAAPSFLVSRSSLSSPTGACFFRKQKLSLSSHAEAVFLHTQRPSFFTDRSLRSSYS